MQAKYLASIILAVLAISIGVLMYTLTTNVIQEFANLLTPSQLNQMKIDVTINRVLFMSSSDGKFIWILVNNKSPFKVYITRIIIVEGISSITEMNSSDSRISPQNPLIDAGETLSITITYEWAEQTQYQIILTVKAEGLSSTDVSWKGNSPVL
mgnify:CR=1 FL=1